MRTIPRWAAAGLLVSAPLSYAGAKDGAPGIKVLAGPAGLALLDQCSRGVPKRGEGTWSPNMVQIQAMERGVLPVVKARHPDLDLSKFASSWGRNYVGVIRGGRRYIYGDYSPGGEGQVCDGGPAFFGAEWDVRAGKLTHLDFNGEA